MSAIHDLIGQISDPRLRERLAAEWKAASQGKKFGLVFEDHLPELLPLPKAKPRRGDLVCRRQGVLKDVWQVKSVKDGVVKAIGLARFAERHGALFGRIQLIRKQASPAGGEHYARLEINNTATIKQLLLITSNPQLDDLFAKLGT